jgi:uncharacterized protein (DUF2141 family)
MLKYVVMSAALGLAALVPALPAAAALGPDAGACRTGSGQAAVLVNVAGFKARTGRIRVQLYGADPSDFLAKGKKLRRIDLSVPAKGAVPICVAVPRPGRYAIAVRHDVNGNGRSGDWSDGGGFSRNPRISLLRLKPRHRDAVINVGTGVTPIQVLLNYRRGLSVGPVGQGA